MKKQSQTISRSVLVNLRTVKPEERKAVKKVSTRLPNSNVIFSIPKDIPSQLKKVDGTYSEDSNEILALLLNTHFRETPRINSFTIIDTEPNVIYESKSWMGNSTTITKNQHKKMATDISTT